MSFDIIRKIDKKKKRGEASFFKANYFIVIVHFSHHFMLEIMEEMMISFFGDLVWERHQLK